MPASQTLTFAVYTSESNFFPLREVRLPRPNYFDDVGGRGDFFLVTLIISQTSTSSTTSRGEGERREWGRGSTTLSTWVGAYFYDFRQLRLLWLGNSNTSRGWGRVMGEVRLLWQRGRGWYFVRFLAKGLIPKARGRGELSQDLGTLESNFTLSENMSEILLCRPNKTI